MMPGLELKSGVSFPYLTNNLGVYMCAPTVKVVFSSSVALPLSSLSLQPPHPRIFEDLGVVDGLQQYCCCFPRVCLKGSVLGKHDDRCEFVLLLLFCRTFDKPPTAN